VTHPKPFYKRNWFNLAFGLAVTALCLWWAFHSMTRDSDPRVVLREVGRAFQNADYRTLPVIWGLLFLFYWLKAWRWTLLLRPLGSFTTPQAFRPVMVGFAFNNLLPAHLGEFVRVFVFSRRHNAAKTAVLSTVVLERVFDILAILGFFFAGLVFTPGLAEDLRRIAWVFAGLVAVALAGAAVYLVWTKPFVAVVEGVLARMRFVPSGFRAKLCHIMEAGAEGLASLKSAPLVLNISWTSVAQWAFNGLMMHLSLWAFGIKVSLLASCLLLGVVAFGVTIPAAPGYFGLIQALFVAVINERTVGIDDKPGVFAASIYFHMSQYVPVTLLGLYYFNRTGLTVSQVEHEAEEEEEALESAAGLSTKLNE
jgi:uncharacterized protein (TIRG00374 family)